MRWPTRRDESSPHPLPDAVTAEGHRPEGVEAVVATMAVEPAPRTRFERLEHGVSAVSRWSLRLLVILLALGVLGYVIREFWSIVLPILLGLLLSTVLWLPARQFRKVMPAALAALLTVVGFLALIAGVFWFLVPRVASQAGSLGDQVTDGLQRLQTSLSQPPLNIDNDQLNSLVDEGVQRVQSNAQTIASGVLSGLTSLGSILITFLLALVLTFFFLKDGPRFLPWLHEWTGGRVARHVDELAGRIWGTIGGYIWSQAAVALVDAVFIGLGIFFLGVPFAFPIAVLVFFGAFIPIVGAVVTGALAALVALVTLGWVEALIVVGIVLLVQQIEGNVLQPFLVGKALSLHPAVVIGAVTVGGTLAGIVGAFLAVPVAAVATVIMRYLREAVLEERPETGGGEQPEKKDDAAARLEAAAEREDAERDAQHDEHREPATPRGAASAPTGAGATRAGEARRPPEGRAGSSTGP